MTKKLYFSAQRDLVYHWADKRFELTSLIIEITGTDEPPWSPPPPTELDELNYQRLRFCNDLQKTLNGKVTELHAIGDCVEPSGIIDAIWQAFHTARRIYL